MRDADDESRLGADASNDTCASDRIHEWRGFVNRWFFYLGAFPHLTVSIARKHGTVGVARAANEFNPAGHDYLLRTGDWEPAVHNSLVIREIVDHLPDDESHFGGMTRDAAVVFGARDPSTYLWETSAGRRHDWHDVMLCISPDGAFAVFERPEFEDNPHSIYVVELETDRVVKELHDVKPLVYWDDCNLQSTVTMQMTPDASTLVFIEGHDSGDQLTSFRIWYPWNDDDFRFEIDDLSPQRVCLAPSGTVAAVSGDQDGNELERFFDLIGRKPIRIADVSADEKAGMRLARNLQKPLCSIDGRITVGQDPARYDLPESERLNCVKILVDGDRDREPLRSFGTERPFGSILGLSADGRLAFADTPRGFAMLDLAEGVWSEPLTDDGGELADTGDPGVHKADSPMPATEQEAVLLEMGVADVVRGVAADGSVVPAIEAEFADLRWELDAEDSESDFPTVYRFHPVLYRQDDHQVLCQFPQVSSGFSSGIASPDATRWCFDASGESGQEPIQWVVDVLTGITSTLHGSGKPITWTRDGRVLITSGPDAGIRLWNCGADEWIDDPALSRLRIEGDSVALSPDGRRLASCRGWGSPTEIVAITKGARRSKYAETKLSDVTWAQSYNGRFSANGRYLITTYQMSDGSTGGHFLWDVQTGQCLDLIADDCDIEGVRAAAPEPIIPWVTGVRIFRPESAPALDNLHEPLYPDGRIPGRFDEEITYRCRHCSRWSPLPDGTLVSIRKIHERAQLSSEDSPVLKLRDGAWSGSGLSVECPHCHQTQKSTPFVVDRQAELGD
jgi:hypothetical protein